MELKLDQATYPIYVVDNQFEELVDRIGQTPGKKLIISDQQVASLYQEQLNTLTSLEDVFLQTVAMGETSKSLNNHQRLCQFLSQEGFTRADSIIAFGGGVIGDLAGFVAATYLRGLHLIQVPTTLLSMVDSSVGGKNGVNFEGLKNQIGTFYFPDWVWIDVNYLKTLEERQVNNGLAEVIKYGVLCRPDLFQEVNRPKNQLDFIKIVQLSLEIKQDYVKADVRDKGKRQFLNLGHTIGHALEFVSQNELNHGEAVAIGLLQMAKASYRLGWADQAFDQAIQELYQLHGLPLSYSADSMQIFEAIKHDKKAEAQQISLIIPKAIGKCCRQTMAMEAVKEWLQ